jgi:acyl-CoA thioester hydrolase
MFVSETSVRVRYAETDQMGVVYYGNYAQYFEVGRVESIRQLGYTYKDMEAEGIIMPVVEAHFRYLRPARYDDLLTVRSQIREMPTHHKIIFHQEVRNEADELLCSGEISLYFIDRNTMKRTAMPPLLKSLLQPHWEEAGGK